MEAVSKQIYSSKGSLAIEVTGQESKTKQYWLESQRVMETMPNVMKSIIMRKLGLLFS